MCICHIPTCTTCIDKTIRQKDAHISRLMKRTHLLAMDILVAKKIESTEASTDTSSDIIISSM